MNAVQPIQVQLAGVDFPAYGRLSDEEIETFFLLFRKKLASDQKDVLRAVNMLQAVLRAAHEREDAANARLSEVEAEKETLLNGPLDQRIQSALMGKIESWLTTINEHGSYTVCPTVEDVRNSSLLKRLLSGKPPLADPPPLSFSVPWYDVVEVDQVHTVQVDNLIKVASHEDLDQWPRIPINQDLWFVKDLIPRERAYIVEYVLDGTPYRLWSEKNDEGATWFLCKMDVYELLYASSQKTALY